ncbi:MFS transporter [Acetobacter conturbans]|uniref:MFS transporter n=1 Tax=Acetobacter conturbans TaxID=1737472 RepID=A0ABX0K220_9PROT|nr:MFS transporter [Acetobacter conturbans]NHN89149.1 MFS transporter [Acetobacter conturbans]
MAASDFARARVATRLTFFASGFAPAGWAPLVPYARQALHADDATMGLLLLCLGLGSLGAMLLTTPLNAKFGSRPVIIAGCIGAGLFLPCLSIAHSNLTLALSLLCFGASIGSLDVTMNVHAAEVEKLSARNLMSGFHALYSIGGFAGASMMTFLLSQHMGPLKSALVCAVIVLVATALAGPGLLQQKGAHEATLFVIPRGIVRVIAALTAIIFLVEGAVLDWGALFATQFGLVSVTMGGLGYTLFAIAMTAGRLTGDRVTAHVGNIATLVGGSVLTIAGFAILQMAPFAMMAMSGFALIGFGASNIVPVLIRCTSVQTVMPSGLAITAVTSVGYAGVLIGPAGVGFVAHALGLRIAFWILAALMLLIPLCARRICSR